MTPDEVTPETLVREILMALPGAPRAFEAHRVDYCCHGALALAEACKRVGADLAAVRASLASEAARPDASAPWRDVFEGQPLAAVVAHLTQEVHAEARRDLDALGARCEALRARGAPLAAISAELDRLRAELGPHLTFEEREVFPYIVALEASDAVPPALFDNLAEPFHMLLREHESADHSLDTLRALTDGYRAPVDADDATRDLYEALGAYDRALVRHMHLEGNVLFPRALRFEAKTRVPAPRRAFR